MILKLTTENVQIIEHKKKQDDDSRRTVTHKLMDMREKIPYMIKKILPNDSMIVDEYSTNIDIFEFTTDVKKIIYRTEMQLQNSCKCVNPEGGVCINTKCKLSKGESKDMTEDINTEAMANKNKIEELEDKEGGTKITKSNEKETGLINYCETTYKSRHFGIDAFRLQVKTLGSKNESDNVFGLTCKYKEDAIDFRTYNKGKMWKVGSRDYSGEWKNRYPVTHVYKMIDVEINSFGFGWITKEIDKLLRSFLVDAQRKILETYDEWIKLSEEELCAMENKVYLKNKYEQ